MITSEYSLLYYQDFTKVDKRYKIENITVGTKNFGTGYSENKSGKPYSMHLTSGTKMKYTYMKDEGSPHLDRQLLKVYYDNI